MFVGDDWYNTEKWKTFEDDFKQVGVQIVYFLILKECHQQKLTTYLKIRENHNLIINELFRLCSKMQFDFFVLV